MERSGLSEGIPSLPEYLADYCSLAVSIVLYMPQLDFVSFIRYADIQ